MNWLMECVKTEYIVPEISVIRFCVQFPILETSIDGGVNESPIMGDGIGDDE